MRRFHRILLTASLPFVTSCAVNPLAPRAESASESDPGLDTGAAHAAADAWIDDSRDALASINRFIWEKAEVGLAELESSAKLAAFLEEHGFDVERGVAAMPTAFVATYGSGEPVVAILAEFDALPGLSQKAVPERTPLIEGAAGHACGHSVFGTASAGGAIAARYAMERHGIGGTLRVYGTPAEETGIGKSYMVKEGLFDGCDAAIHWHPGSTNNTTYSRSKAVVSIKYTFLGLPAHASLSPHEGRSALDAVELMNVGANYLREHVGEDARIHYVITDGGGQPNVVPPRAQVWYYLRANDHRDVEQMSRRMESIARGAALMTETELEIEIQSDSHELIPNRPLSEVIQRQLERVGPPAFTDAERAFARKTQEPLIRARGKDIDKALADAVEPLSAEPELIKASTDVGDVSWKLPTGGFRTACFTYDAPGHSWQVVACTGMSIGEKGLIAAAKVIAGSALGILANPAVIEEAKADLERELGGRAYTTLIPKEQRAPKAIR